MGEDGTNQYTGNSNEGTSEDGTGMTELILIPKIQVKVMSIIMNKAKE